MPNQTYGRSHGRSHFGRRNYSRYVTKGYLRAIVGKPESKWFNTNVAPAAVGAALNAGSVYAFPLNQIPQGITQSTRIGDAVSNKSLHIRLDIQRAAVDAIVRVIVFWYLDGNTATTPVPPSLLLEDPANYRSPLNKDQGKSFWVKFDKTYSVASGQTAIQVDEVWRKLKCQTEYTSDAESTPSNNTLYIAALCNQTTVANQPLMSFTSRITYLDL